MSDDKIALEIQDRIAPTIRRKIDEIGSAADRADVSVERLKSHLAQLGGAGALRDVASKAGGLETARAKAAAASNLAALNEQKLATATARTTAATLAAAKAAQQLSAAEQSTAKATAQAAAAQDKAATSALRLQKAQASAGKNSAANLAIRRGQQSMRIGGLGGGAGAPAAGGDDGGGIMSSIGGLAMRNPYTAAAAVVGAATVAVGKYADSYNVLRNRVQTSTGSLESAAPVIDRIAKIANATAAPLNETGEAFVRFDRALKQMGKTQEDSLQFTETMQTMLFRYGKTGSEAASVTLQLSQAMGKGKLDGDEFRSVMENLPELMESIAKELGTTKAGLREMAPEGKITGEVIMRAMTNAKASLDAMPQPIDTADAALTRLGNNLEKFWGETAVGQGIVNGFTSAINAMAKAFETANGKLPKEQAGDAPASDKGDYYSKKQAEAQAVFDAVKKKYGDAAAARESFLQTETTSLQRAQDLLKMPEKLRSVETGLDKLKVDGLKEGITLTDDYLGAQRKLLEATYDLEQSQKKSGGAKGVNRAEEIEKVNRLLDQQIGRMGEVASVREANARYDSIEESLLAKKIKLTEAESRAIYEKIEAIQTGAPVQAEFDRIVKESESSAQKYLITLDGAKMAYDAGKISLEQFNQQLLVANDNFLESTDPLHESNKAFERQGYLLQFNTREREIESQVMAVVDAQRAKGIDLLDKSNAEARQQLFLLRETFTASRDAAEADAARNEMLDSTTEKQRLLNVQLAAYTETKDKLKAAGFDATKRQEIGGDFGVMGETYFKAQAEARRHSYEEIDAMRKADIFNEQEATNAKLRVWQAEQNAKLGLAKDFFSNFEGMQRSNWAEMAAVGKAAAIASATIQTYQAAQGAYAAMSAIPMVGPALGAVAAAAAIASGMANVNAIASQPTGFAQGGYTGNLPANEVAGVVHGQEYVLDAATTKRLGRNNLDAMSRGQPSGESSSSSKTDGQPVSVNLTVVVVGSEQEAKQFLAGKEAESIIINTVAKNARQVNKVLKSA